MQTTPIIYFRHVSESDYVEMSRNTEDVTLSSSDLGILCNLLTGAAVRWTDLGLQLEVHIDDLDAIRTNPTVMAEGVRGYMREMLSLWLRGTTPGRGAAAPGGLPTLDALIKALRSPVIGEVMLASELRTRFVRLRESQPAQPIPSTNVVSSASPFTRSSTDIELGLEDLVDVSTYLLTLSKEQIFSLGLVLGLAITTLQPIRDSFLFLDDMLAAWLQGKDQVGRRGGHSWQALVHALKHPKVNQTEIADRIEEERCP